MSPNPFPFERKSLLTDTARIFVLAIAAAVTGCGTAARQQAPVAPRPIESYVGDYVSAHDTLYIRENDGRLEAVIKKTPHALEPIAGDTFTTGSTRVVVGERVAQYGDLVLQRRDYAVGTFHITPVRPVAELRVEALAATPPAQPDSLRAPDLVELKSLDPTIKYDIRYATTNNFMGDVFYSSSHAFLQRPAAEAVARASKKLNRLGYGLLIHDAYRPWYVTKMFWDATPDSLHDFVANPRGGSRHNRGAAVDLSLYDLDTGRPVTMTGGYDEFSERSFPQYPGGTTAQREKRELLRRIMESEGFRVYEFEWWHFDYKDWSKYPISNFTFEQLLQ